MFNINYVEPLILLSISADLAICYYPSGVGVCGKASGGKGVKGRLK